MNIGNKQANFWTSNPPQG